MVKGLAALLVLLALGGGVYLYLRAPARRICLVMGDICHGHGGKRGHYDDFFACVDSVDELAGVFGDDAIAQAAVCVDAAQDCAEGVRCMAGAATMGE